MSGRIGKRELAIPAGVEVKVSDGQVVVKGPKGTLTQALRPQVAVKVEGQKVLTVCATSERLAQAMQGLYNSLIKNMITGVTTGFQKDLDLVGVGYRAAMAGKKLQLQLGYSHPVEFEPPTGIEFSVQGNTRVIVKGADRQAVGQIAAEIRLAREVEPYKGKGIKYLGEIVRRKAGKAAKAASAGGGA
ncbi:MAG: 50S ribosomal protein L6 [Candidatus Margulisbacteria bacterium]|jgi:large subunit ribosomal protein L6|nr:50S ribosomal protein L6 [Candidatus Margulisiibacteriota bacterium]